MFHSIHTSKMFARLSLMVLLTFLFSACATVPGTGRRQLSMVSDESLAAEASEQYASMIEEATLSTDAEDTALIVKVGEKISQAAEAYLKEYGLEADIANYNWEFNLIESPKANAFCMPGGKIAFYSGILPYCQDETGIAVIMGHEVGHAIAKHGGERRSQNALAGIGALILGVGMIASGSDESSVDFAAELYGTSVTLAFLLPYSRTHESEADRIGLSLMAMAGYDPNAAVDFWQRMAADNSTEVPGFLSTHPSNEKRIADIEEFIPEALVRYKAE